MARWHTKLQTGSMKAFTVLQPAVLMKEMEVMVWRMKKGGLTEEFKHSTAPSHHCLELTWLINCSRKFKELPSYRTARTLFPLYWSLCVSIDPEQVPAWIIEKFKLWTAWKLNGKTNTISLLQASIRRIAEESLWLTLSQWNSKIYGHQAAADVRLSIN